jgi:hypothetical protein
MLCETGKRDRTRLPHDPFKAIVAPRPIGWISTRALDGRINLAPYSFFSGFSSAPPIVGFSSEGWKDSASFAQESGEFVANLATSDLRHPMNATSAARHGPRPSARALRLPGLCDRRIGLRARAPEGRRRRVIAQAPVDAADGKGRARFKDVRKNARLSTWRPATSSRASRAPALRTR